MLLIFGATSKRCTCAARRARHGLLASCAADDGASEALAGAVEAARWRILFYTPAACLPVGAANVAVRAACAVQPVRGMRCDGWDGRPSSLAGCGGHILADLFLLRARSGYCITIREDELLGRRGHARAVGFRFRAVEGRALLRTGTAGLLRFLFAEALPPLRSAKAAQSLRDNVRHFHFRFRTW